ncbi:BBRPI [Aedoeadaptatus ivorii]|uniref:BBRPI n=1 Tax=Aedoeadaptatus ivorii TaxID=54006 RepID=A0A448UZR8_9FIRM|nr:copper amine oxidase N-terminal domain-containing protein [Peptoniphilus ivorii]VEJ34469.1 BBRPI [Peptoniphilus ivorii]
MKKSIVLAVLCCFLSTGVFAQSAPNMHIFLEGKSIQAEEGAHPIVKDDRICLPLRYIAESLGYTVDWNAEKRVVTVKDGEKTLAMTIGKKAYVAGKENKKMDVAPFIEGDRTYLPMRFVGEALGKEVKWDSKHRIAQFGTLPHVKAEKGEKISVSDGYKFVIPKALEDTFVCKNTTTGILLFDKKNYEAEGDYDGFIGNFVLTEAVDTETVSYILGEIDGKYLVFYTVGDVNYNHEDVELTRSYKDATEKVVEVLKTVEVEK